MKVYPMECVVALLGQLCENWKMRVIKTKVKYVPRSTVEILVGKVNSRVSTLEASRTAATTSRPLRSKVATTCSSKRTQYKFNWQPGEARQSAWYCSRFVCEREGYLGANDEQNTGGGLRDVFYWTACTRGIPISRKTVFLDCLNEYLHRELNVPITFPLVLKIANCK